MQAVQAGGWAEEGEEEEEEGRGGGRRTRSQRWYVLGRGCEIRKGKQERGQNKNEREGESSQQQTAVTSQNCWWCAWSLLTVTQLSFTLGECVCAWHVGLCTVSCVRLCVCPSSCPERDIFFYFFFRGLPSKSGWPSRRWMEVWRSQLQLNHRPMGGGWVGAYFQIGRSQRVGWLFFCFSTCCSWTWTSPTLNAGLWFRRLVTCESEVDGKHFMFDFYSGRLEPSALWMSGASVLIVKDWSPSKLFYLFVQTFGG